MKKNDKGSHAPGPVADLVNEMLQNVRSTRVDGPSSMLHGARAQLSTTVNQAGTLLAKLDRAAPPAHKPSLLQSVLGLAAAKAPDRTALEQVDRVLGLVGSATLAYDDPRRNLSRRVRVDDGRLVGVRLAVRTLKDAVVVPQAAIVQSPLQTNGPASL